MFQVNLQEIPEEPGVYTFIDEKGKILYAGKALNLRKRVASYFNSSDKPYKTIRMVESAAELKFIVTNNEKEALLLENNIIKNEKPKYNIRLKDAKSYPYIKITQDDFPRLIITRDINKKDGLYFGPFVDASGLRGIVHEILKIFPIRTCSESKFKLKKTCLNYQIKQCSGPCEGLISKEDYNKLVEEAEKLFTGKVSELKEIFIQKMQDYSKNLMFEEAAKMRDRLRSLEEMFIKQGTVISQDKSVDIFIFDENEQFFTLCTMFIRYGKLVGVKVDFLETYEEFDVNLFILQYYSLTMQLPETICIVNNRNVYKDTGLIQQAIEEMFGQKLQFAKTISTEILSIGYNNIRSQQEIFLKKNDNIIKALTHLTNTLHLKEIKSIECLDISHLYGVNTVGATVRWTQKGFEKNRYRKYRIRNEANDDFYAIYEVMKRKGERIKKGEEELADLYLIDGGLGQLNAALKGFKEAGVMANIISISKGRSIRDHKFVSDNSIESIHLPNRKNSITLKKNDPAMLLLQKIRDETHRFVIEYMRSSYEKLLTSSGILNIKGIGKARVKKILKIYPDILKRTGLTPQEISKNCGIPLNVAEELIGYIERLGKGELISG